MKKRSLPKTEKKYFENSFRDQNIANLKEKFVSNQHRLFSPT